MLKKIITRDNMYPPPEIYSEITKSDVISEWKKYLQKKQNNKLWLYIHIPFCKSKCNFCHCKSLLVNNNNLEKYINYINSEIDIFSKVFKWKKKFDNIYFGWWTPSILSEIQLENLLLNLINKCNIGEGIPFCFEAMPETLTKNKIDILAKYWVSRLSLGVQSLNEKTLKAINRKQNISDLLKITQYAKTKIKYLNLDLVCWLENETLETFKEWLKTILEMKSDIIHIYRFNPSETTLFSKSWKKYSEEDRNLSEEMYQLAIRKIIESWRIKLKNDDYWFSLNARNINIVHRIEDASSNLWIWYSARSNIFWQLSYINSWITDENLIYTDSSNNYLWYYYWLEEEKTRYVLQNLVDGLNQAKYKELYNSDFLVDFREKISYLLEKYWKNSIITNNWGIKFNLEKYPNYIMNSILFSREIIQAIKQYEIWSK